MRRSRQIGLGLLGAIALLSGGGAIAVEPMVAQGELAIELAQSNQDSKKAEADRLLEQGRQQFWTSQFREALQSWETALGLYRELGDRQGEADSLGNLGVAYFSIGNYSRAIDLQNQVLPIILEIGDRQREAIALGNLGRAHHALGEYEQALNFYNRAWTITNQIGFPARASSSLRGLGNIYSSLKQYEQAIIVYNQALIIDRKTKDLLGQVYSLSGLGNAYFSLGDSEKAIDFYDQALRIDREINNRSGESIRSDNLGAINLRLSRYEPAIRHHEHSLIVAREIGDFASEGESLRRLGLAYTALGQYEHSINLYQTSLNIFRKIGDRLREADSLDGIGFAYSYLNDYTRAIKFHRQSLEIDQETGNPVGKAYSFNGLGLAYRALGKYKRAVDLYNQSLEIYRDSENRLNAIQSLNGLGNVYYFSGKYEQAIIQFRNALELTRETNHRETERVALANLGRSFREKGQIDTALALFKQSINIAESIRNDNKNLDKPLQDSYTDVVADDYRELADLLLTQGRVLEAQQVLDLLAIEEIRDYNQNTRATVLASGEVEYTDTETEIRDRHDSLINLGLEILRCEAPDSGCRDQLPTLRNQHKALVIQFNETAKALNQQTIARQSQEDGVQLIAGLNNSARKLVEQKENTLFVYTFINVDSEDPTKGTLWLIWVGPGGVVNTIDREINPTELANTALKFRQLLTSSKPYDANEFQTLSQQLHRWIIDPLQGELDKNNIQHLIFRLDRELRYVPMAALHNGNSYLVERYTVANVINALSTNVSDRLAPNRDSNPILALGLSKNLGEGALPHVPAELDAIVQEQDSQRSDPNGGLFPGDSFLDETFTFDALQNNLGDRRILHIATHGNFSPVNAFGTYLRLGDGQRLPLADIQTLSDLGRIHLAVLSACETGLSGNPDALKQAAVNRPDGREINSLLYAFTSNNQAKAVLSTLWKVDDGYTRIFMEEFYKNLNNHPQLTKAEVLRKTQLTFLNNEVTGPSGTPSKASHPYNWAPFTLTGNSW